jgi:photosystem II stability/assembly factor-like uncharacterized protein
MSSRARASHVMKARRAALASALTILGAIGQFTVSRAQSTGYDARFFQALKWRSVGPLRGGRSITSAGSASRPNEYYFGATGGGLWKTTDAGLTWAPVTDGQIKSSSVGAVAIAESNPDIVYIGMGETCIRGNIMQGDGVYKSTDAGKTWTHTGLADTQAISKIRVHPANPDIVFVAAFGHPAAPNPERGVFKSTDGGRTWKKVLFRDPRTAAIDLAIDRQNPSVMYAALWEAYRVSWQMSSGGPGSGLFKSTDGGDTWTEITRSPGMPAGVIGRIGIAVSGADSNRVYALVENENGGLFRSEDAGATWTKVNEDRNLRQRAFYYTHIFADPKNKDIVYGLNVNFFKSTDGGKTFKTQLRPPHGDNHDMWIDPNNPNRFITSDDGGATVTTNGGQTWTNEEFPTAQLYHVATTKDFPYHVCGAQQDNTTVCVQSVAAGRGFGGGGTAFAALYQVGGGESGYIAPSPKDPNVFYAGSQGALLTRYDRLTGQTRDIEVYPRFFSGENAASLPDRWQWTYPIVFSPFDSNVIYTSSQFLYKTTNDGQSWTKISPDLTKHDPKTLGDSGGPITHDMNGPEIFATIFAIAPSRKEADTIWTGSDDGLVYITRDGGKSWTNVTPPGAPELGRVSIIDASPHVAGAAYVAIKNYLQDDRKPYLFKTSDFGRTWRAIVAGIGDADYVHAVREDPKRPGLLYAGAEHGIYISFDAGDHWQSLSLNLPDTQVSDIVVEEHDLVIATHGRSMYVLDNIAPLRQLTPDVSRTTAVHLYAPEEGTRRPRPVAIDYYLKARADKVTIDILDSHGNVVRTFAGPPPEPKPGETDGNEDDGGGRGGPPPRVGVEAGLNRFVWDMRYAGATPFQGLVMWGAQPQQGPLAVPGSYQARVTADGHAVTQPFTIVMDPRTKVTPAELQEQFNLAIKVRDRVSEANEAVVAVRRVREQVNDRIEKAKFAERDTSRTPVTTALESLKMKLTGVEEAVYQVRNRSGQDPLNFPIKLNNKIAHLMGVIEGADARPTDQTHAAFSELSTELQAQLDKLNEALSQDLSATNKMLLAKKIQPISMVQTKR